VKGNEMSSEQELTELVKKLTKQITELQFQIKSLKAKTGATIPEDHLATIAAAVAAYLGYEGEPRQPHFNAPKALSR
jgi:hypothetical protein